MPNGEEPRFAASRGAWWLAVVGLIGAVLAAYHNSLAGPFVFDDGAAITGNPTIRRLSDLGAVLSPPREGGQTVGGRPLVNLTLAVNYALGGADVRGYHAFNLGVHVLGALLLFGIVRRTLLRPGLSARFGAAATPLALAVALLWAVHPLLTESVTYVIQRAESLMGLFYLLTLYAFIRGWLVPAVVACVLGMATKEVMVTAPVLVLLYDRTFVAGSWRAAWVQRKAFYASLAAAWLLLGWLVLGAENRGGTAGLGLGDSVWTYALTQTRAMAVYLRLALWPHPLVFDYGTEMIEHLADALPFALLIAGLMAAAVWALVRRPVVGFLGAWFFAILAPSSSVVPIPVQTMAEHRMYLPLAAVVALAVPGLYSVWRRGCWLVLAVVAFAFAMLTVARNADYRSAVAIWADTVAKRPANARAALRLDRPAVNRGARSIRGDILVNSGNALRALGRVDDAVQRYEEALRLDPNLPAARFNLGGAYLQTNRFAEAADQFEQVLAIDPGNAAAHTGLGSALLLRGQTEAALGHYEAALRLDPSAKAHQDLGIALLEQAVRLEPEAARAHGFLGDALAAQGRPAEAAGHYRRALQLEPGNERVRRALEALPAPSR
jgi:tetratricopeptide (TPR) repeat protein